MNNKLILPHDLPLLPAMRHIEEELKKSSQPLTIDMSEAGFPLTRDVFLVMKKRFRSDQFHLLLAHEYEVDMARSLGIGAEVAGVRAEFDREFSKKNILKHNFTMWEYFLYELRRGWEYIQFLFTRKRKSTPLYKIKKGSPNMFLIVSGLIMSLSLLLFIFYFAVSKTYVSVLPDTTVRPVSANIIFSLASGSLLESKNTVRMKKINLPVDESMRFTLDTVDPNSATNAIGRVTVYNELPTEQALKPFTRFITEDGVVFRSESWANVPPAREINGITEIGSVELLLKADPNDESGKMIGERGNIPTGTYLSIPGLKFNRDKVYAKAKETFVWWAPARIHVVTEEEVKKFEWILKEQLSRTARTRLQEWLDEQNKNSGEAYSLLSWESVTMTGYTIGIISWQKMGDLANEIELKWSVAVTALVYDKSAVVEYLTGLFREKLLRGTDKELAIHPDTLRLTNVISRADDGSSIKATMEMNTTITYDLENASNELTRRMKIMIAWLTRKDAVNRLINEWHVREVEVSFSPFWLTRVSSNLDNIEFIIKK